MWFYCEMLRIPRTEDVNSERVLRNNKETDPYNLKERDEISGTYDEERGKFITHLMY